MNYDDEEKAVLKEMNDCLNGLNLVGALLAVGALLVAYFYL